MGSVALRSTSVSPIVTLGTRTLITQVSTLPDSRRQMRTDCARTVLGAHSIGRQRPRSALKGQRNRLPSPAHGPHSRPMCRQPLPRRNAKFVPKD
jgi:hypothetical protein